MVGWQPNSNQAYGKPLMAGVATPGTAVTELVAEEITAQSAYNVANGPRLAAQLTKEEAESAFTATGELSPEALQGATQIIDPAKLGNPAVPSGFGKYTTQTFASPSGSFQVHFYMNPTTRQVFYELDFKAIFNSGVAGRP